MLERVDCLDHQGKNSVSVIMPAFNAERFVAQAVGSLLEQTYDNWHLIVVDDGSTDGTPEVLRQFTDPRITVIHQENCGEAAARNAGLAHAQGIYIAFLDADDLYLPNALADHVRFLSKHPEFDVSFSDGFFCDTRGERLMRLSEHRPGVHTGIILEPLLLNASVLSGIICTMTRRLAIEKSGVHFDERLVIGPDWDFWIHLARHARFGYLDTPTCMYRIHATNITRTTNRKKRTLDLLQGRLKIMHSEWFGDLPPSTRQDFFQQILVELLSGDVERQQAIFDAEAFRGLPDQQRANLLRLVAAHYLRRKRELAFAQACLLGALAACPGERKSRALMSLLRLGPSVCAATLQGWHLARGVWGRVKSVGRRRPRPVPTALAPISD